MDKLLCGFSKAAQGFDPSFPCAAFFFCAYSSIPFPTLGKTSTTILVLKGAGFYIAISG
jgi:hypothetical protein